MAISTAKMRRRLSAVALVSAAVLLAGCFPAQDEAQDGEQILRIAVGAEIDALDPQYINAGNYVVPSGLLEGLVMQNDTGDDVVPAIAESWTVSDDGTTYTFVLRDDAKFSNGDAITADDVVGTYKRLLAPTGAGVGQSTNSPSYQVGLGILGATDYQSGAESSWDTVGVRAVDDKTVEIELDAPNPDFLMGLTDNSMMILDPAAIEANPKDWTSPENWVGSGPFVPETWDPTVGMHLVPNEYYWDKDNVHLDAVDIRVIVDAQAATLAYRSGEVDVTVANQDLLPADDKLRKDIKEAEGYSIFFLNIQYSDSPATMDLRVRQALSLAIDRDKLAELSPGTQPATSMVPGRVPGREDSMDTSVYDPERAAELLAEAGYPNGEGMPTVQIFDHRPRPVADAVVDMWKKLGVQAKVEVVDLGIFADERFQVIKDPNTMGFYPSGFGGIPTLNNWISTFWGPQTTMQFSLPADAWRQYQAVQADESLDGATKAQKLDEILNTYASDGAKEFADLVQEARLTTDEDQRNALYVQAATLRESLGQQVPLLEESQAFLVNPRVEGLNVRTTMEGFYWKGITLAD